MAQADTAKSALERVRSLHIGSARDAEAAIHTTRLLATDEQGALTPVAKRFTRTGETRGVMLIGGAGKRQVPSVGAHAVQAHGAAGG